MDRNKENQRCFYERIENSVGERKDVSVGITATNELGESLKQEKANIQQVKAEGSIFK